MAHRYTSPKLSLLTILKWQLSKRFSTVSSTYTPMPIEYRESLPEGNYALWLGHATVWLQLAETTIAIDPVLGNIPMYSRYTPLPIPQEHLHTNIILITHAHYDHFDKPSVLALLKKNKECIVVAPIGFWRYLKGHIAREKCFELEWWESVMINGLFITLTPSKHWSKRTPFDTNKALWGGYVIQNQDHCIYHSGDTAEGEHFKEIGERFDIDEAFLPIGAYRPEAIMKHNHTNPPEAINACMELGAKTLIPIHYGTFKLSDEPLDEPREWFEYLVSQNTYSFKAHILNIGEVYRFKETSTFKST
jgi:L-ascorbate metabolism protein UlaG (beta-lactamase superfamily)